MADSDGSHGSFEEDDGDSEFDLNRTPEYFEATYHGDCQFDLNRHPEYFEETYRSTPVSWVENYRRHEDGNRIIMPASAIDKLSKLVVRYPMMFQIENASITVSGGDPQRVSHCGVLEFSSEEGSVYLPQWMMENLKLDPGSLVVLKNVELPKGTYMKIQPHSTNFIKLPNPKEILEAALKNFACVTAGDTIEITHNYNRYSINILETKPSKAISVVETDCEVDFAPPLDYQEPETKPPKSEGAEDTQNKDDQEEHKFKAFSGAARRLDGQPVTSMPPAAPPSNVEQETDHTKKPPEVEAQSGVRKRAGKLVFAPEGEMISNQPKKSKATSEEVSPKKKEPEVEDKMFQPFTGKKYTLAG